MIGRAAPAPLVIALFAGRCYSTDNEHAELTSRLRRIERRLDRLDQQSDADWITTRRAAELRTMVEDVLHDADTRASLQAGAVRAGHDGQFFIETADGRYRFAVTGQLQSRFVWNHQDDAPAGDDTRYGFDLRRIRLRFQGHLITPRLRYVFGLGSGGPDSQINPSDINVAYDVDEDTTLIAGRFLLPNFQRE